MWPLENSNANNTKVLKIIEYGRICNKNVTLKFVIYLVA